MISVEMKNKMLGVFALGQLRHNPQTSMSMQAKGYKIELGRVQKADYRGLDTSTFT